MSGLCRHLLRAAVLPVLVSISSIAWSQTTSFTYQGKLTDNGSAASGNYDFRFTLWDASANGNQIPVGAPITLTRSGVSVVEGAFTVQLDFTSSAFPGADRFLEISVKHPADGSYTLLTQRQQITSEPYSLRALSAPFGGVTGGTNTSGLIIGSGGTLTATGTGTIAATSAPAGALTGTTLAASVTGSSLTSVGTLTALTINGSLNMTTHAITNVTTPVSGADAANKSYVDSAVAASPASAVGTFLLGRHFPNSNATAPYYLPLNGAGGILNTSTNPDRQADLYIPKAGIIETMRVDTFGTFASSATYTLYRNGAATAFTCTIAANPSNCASTGSLAVVAGDRLHIRIEGFAGMLPSSASGFIMYTGVHIK